LRAVFEARRPLSLQQVSHHTEVTCSFLEKRLA